MKFVLGVDEAGRAPLAGPVSVGVVAVPEGFDVAKEFPGVRDSKQMTELARERVFEMLEDRAKAGDVRFRVTFGSRESIDERGITIAVKQAMRRGVTGLVRSLASQKLAFQKSDCFIYLDGLLHAPSEYAQETVVHGDDLVPVISLASVAAKVVRDRLMRTYDTRFPLYGFAKHKGYPTAFHYEMLEKHGPCEIHRLSYLHLAAP